MLWTLILLTVFELPTIVKRRFFYKYSKTKNNLLGKTVVITGGCGGIGREVVLDFYQRGGRIVVADINENYFKDLENYVQGNSKNTSKVEGCLAFVPINLASMKSVRKCAEIIKSTESRIDILVNNAGVMRGSKLKTEDGFEEQMAVNYFGHVLLTLLLLPLMIKTRTAKILNTTSVVHKHAKKMNFDDLYYEKTNKDCLLLYCVSKLAIMMFGVELSKQLRNHDVKGVNVYNIHPGDCWTNIAKPPKKDSFLKKLVWILYGISWIIMQKAKYGAQTIIHCALSDICSNHSGHYYSNCSIQEPSEESQDPNDAENLWNLTIDILKKKVPDFSMENIFNKNNNSEILTR